MPALDRLHHTVKNALVKDGWTVTEEPLTLKVGTRSAYVDIAAERIITAERGLERIAVEVKEMNTPSFVAELERVIGQYSLYEDILAELQSDRQLYLAVPQSVLDRMRGDDFGRLALQRRLRYVVAFTPMTEEITEWITPTQTGS